MVSTHAPSSIAQDPARDLVVVLLTGCHPVGTVPIDSAGPEVVSDAWTIVRRSRAR